MQKEVSQVVHHAATSHDDGNVPDAVGERKEGFVSAVHIVTNLPGHGPLRCSREVVDWHSADVSKHYKHLFQKSIYFLNILYFVSIITVVGNGTFILYSICKFL